MSKKRAQVLLIPAPALRKGWLMPFYPIGLYSLQAAARRSGFAVDVLDLTHGVQNQEYTSAPSIGEAILSQFDPGAYRVIGLSTVADTFPVTLFLAQKIKLQNPDVTVVFGGPHASFLPAETLEDFPFVDAVVVGEAEDTFVEMLQTFHGLATDWAHAPGVMTHNGRFSSRPLIQDLDRLPVLDLEADLMQRCGYTFVNVEALRGCFARCKFCSTTRLWRNRVRRKSPARLVEEMARHSETTGLRRFAMIGDNFSFPVRALGETCEHLRRSSHIFEWHCGLRVGDLVRDDLVLMKEAGCCDIFVGIESASQATIERITKGIDLAKTVNMIYEAIALGIGVNVSQIVGFPWERESDVMLVLKQHSELLKAGALSSRVNALMPLPGAEGFPDTPIVMDPRLIKDSIPAGLRDDYTLDLIRRLPRHFIQFGHYKTPGLDRSFIRAATETAEQVTRMRASTRG